MVYYFYITNFILTHPHIYTLWINKIIHYENMHLYNLNYIFCNDNYLLNLHIKYLNNNQYTDILTFNNSNQFNDEIASINGDIFISIDRIRENAIQFKQNFNNELQRVMVHGVLHLIGYNDHNINEVHLMRNKENFYINLFNNL